MPTRFSNPKDDEDDEDALAEERGLRRWLIASATNGPMAEDAHMPSWYPYLRAAERLGCRVWELVDVPQYYINIALTALRAEADAQRAIDKPPTPKKK